MSTPFELGTNEKPTPTIPPADFILTPDTQPPESGVWMPVDLPSMGLAGYPAQISIRKFGVPDLARLGAARKAGSYQLVVAAIGATIHGVDVRMLTHGDFDHIMYWHTINSLLKRPVIVTWQSRYGDSNKTVVDKTIRKNIFIENATKVREMQDRGFDFSRVGDELWRLHAIDTNVFSDAVEVEFALATWVKVDNPMDFESKLQKVRSMQDLSFYEDLDEWRTIANHGVSDTAMLTCEHFTPLQAPAKIIRALAHLDAAVSIGEFDESVTKLNTSLLSELATLRKLEAEGNLALAKPVEEEVFIPLDVTNFFPVLL